MTSLRKGKRFVGLLKSLCSHPTDWLALIFDQISGKKILISQLTLPIDPVSFLKTIAMKWFCDDHHHMQGHPDPDLDEDQGHDQHDQDHHYGRILNPEF